MATVRVLGTALLLFAVLAFSSIAQEGLRSMRGGGTKTPELDNCIPPEARAKALSEIALYEKRFGPVKPVTSFKNQKLGPTGLALYHFFPQAGVLYSDLFLNNFVDMDPTAGIRDFACTDFTYNGHMGIDSDIATWTQKDLGVPIFAALPGTVVARDDGHFDEQTSWNPSNQANHVILDHGGGHTTWYWHMKNGSVAVQVNDVVRAGQQLGMTASSGYSTNPHLHFESRLNNVFFEQFAGPCGPVQSNWTNQPTIVRSLYLREFNLTGDDLSAWPGPPADTGRKGWFNTGAQPIRMWIYGHNLPANSTQRLRFVRPDSTVKLDGGLFNFNNPFWRWFWWNWDFTVDFDVTGTWHVQLLVNDSILASAPFEVKSSSYPAVNRPPVPMRGVFFTPALPTPQDAIRCTVDADQLFRDPDYDQVRYHYVWRINHAILRDVTTAALSDMIPAESAAWGDLLECAVTPTDGSLSAPTQTISYSFPRNAVERNWDHYH